MVEPTTTTISRLQTLPCLDKSKASIPVLSSKIHRPVCMPKAIGVWNRLQQIEYIDVVPVESTNEALYSVNIFLRHNQHHIPVNHRQSSQTSTSPVSRRLGAMPDHLAVHSFSDLDTLRHQILASVRQDHPMECELCNALSLQLLTKLYQPVIFTATIHRSQKKRAKKMETFLTRVLAELYEKRPHCVAGCKAQNALPMFLGSFLFGPEEESTTSS